MSFPNVNTGVEWIGQIVLFGGKKAAGALSLGALEALSSMRAGRCQNRCLNSTPRIGKRFDGVASLFLTIPLYMAMSQHASAARSIENGFR